MRSRTIGSVLLVATMALAACDGGETGASPGATPRSSAAAATTGAVPSLSTSAVPSGTPVPTVAATARPTQTPTPEPAAEAFSLTSPAFADGKAIPARYTCDGRDVSPPLTWTGLPDATVALLLTMHDPDAGGFLHWIAWNIPADVDHLAAGASGDLPKGAGEGRNDFPSGGRGYRGPCPPSGRHRYVLTLYALPIRLPDAASTPADQLESAAREVALGTATLHGTYRRP